MPLRVQVSVPTREGLGAGKVPWAVRPRAPPGRPVAAVVRPGHHEALELKEVLGHKGAALPPAAVLAAKDFHGHFGLHLSRDFSPPPELMEPGSCLRRRPRCPGRKK